MKNVFLFLIAILLLGSCAKQTTVEQPVDKFNGYAKYLKSGEQIHILYAGQTTVIGTVTYGIDNDANFYATYEMTESGWTMSQSHMFAGDKLEMPLNKPGNPKIGKFPYTSNHNPRVSTFTYTVPLIDLPPCEDPGFVVAAHGIVFGPDNQQETAWAGDQFPFTDKGWGWYDVYYYNQPPNQFTILYGTAYTNDTLKLYHMDVTNGTTEMILKEYIGAAPGGYDGAAYDVESGRFFFSNYSSQELYINQLNDIDPSYSAGTLQGTAASGTYFSGAYYYIDANANTINMVNFDPNWMIAQETVLDSVPSTITVNDITMSPDGTTLYMLGEVNDGGRELLSWDVATETFYTMSITLGTGGQLTYGSDGVLYAIAPITEGGSHSLTYTVDPTTGTLTVVEDDIIIIIEDPFSDISMGPIM